MEYEENTANPSEIQEDPNTPDGNARLSADQDKLRRNRLVGGTHQLWPSCSTQDDDRWRVGT